MAKFSQEYYAGEEREGYYVEEQMKRAWAAQIELLEIIDFICKKHGITYYADWGTLLGAVRHKGFIPWDDDMDITMKRADYNRFISIANRELPEGIFLHSIYTQTEYRELFARVVNSHQINFTEEHLSRWHGCPYIVGIDIFPMDNLPWDIEEEEMQMKLLGISLRTLQAFVRKEEGWETYVEQMEALCGVAFDRTKDLENQILRVTDGIRQMYDEDGGDYTQLTVYIQNKEYRIPPEYLDEIIWKPFEVIELPVPKEYDAILTRMYGDYKIPEQKVSHDYPFYKKQQEIVDDYRKKKMQIGKFEQS